MVQKNLPDFQMHQLLMSQKADYDDGVLRNAYNERKWNWDVEVTLPPPPDYDQ